MIISQLLLFFLVRWSWGHCHLLRNVLQQSDLLFFDNGAVNIPYETNQGLLLYYQWPGHFWKQKTINKTSRQHKQHHYAPNLQYMKDTLMNADWNPQYKKKSKQPCARMMMNPKSKYHLAETMEATGTKSFQIRNRCRTGKRLDQKRCWTTGFTLGVWWLSRLVQL